MFDFHMQQSVSRLFLGGVEPPLSPEDKPTPAELAQLAKYLLQELSRDDARVAEKMRERGLDPLPPRPRR